MGTSPLPETNPVVETDEHYLKEVAIRRNLLRENHTYYYRSGETTLPAQWEVLELVLDGLAAQQPGSFILKKSGASVHWENKLLNEIFDFEIGNPASLPLEPLDWVGRQVQEDLTILDSRTHLAAGQLCFPSGWSLEEKFERHFLEIHAPLPSLLNPMLQAADKLIERIPMNKPMARTNWGFRVTDQLDLSVRHSGWYKKLLNEVSSEITAETAGDKLHFRIERQTLSRLQSGHVLFTIHTYNNKLSDEIKDKDRAKAMLTYLSTVPPELLEYKQMTPFADKLIRYLESVQ